MKSILGNHKLIGLVFVAMMASGVWLTGAIFNKTFAEYDEVTLEASSIGLQMPERADVKIRGVIVGEVLDFDAAGEGAEITLGLYPDSTETIPENVTARIEPKTLFGEKYVSLEVPEQPSGQPIQEGARITQTRLATEVEQTLNDLYPLLRAVQPADINTTLNAVATALEGRGELLGENIETLDSYLKRMNPLLPELVDNIRALGETSDLYADVLPEIATTLRNSVTTGNTLLEREDRLNGLLEDVRGFSNTTRTFLDANERNLIRVNQLGSEQLSVFAKYAPMFSCLTKGIVLAGERQAEAFRGYTLHINLELLPNQPRAYGPQDAPRFGDKRGPYCGSLPNSPYNQQNRAPFPDNADDGVDEPTGKGTMRTQPGFGSMTAVPGSLEELAMVRGLRAASTGQPDTEVSDLDVLLLAPLMRGGEVTMR